MRLRAVEVQNFRAFRQARLYLPADGLVLIAGPNNSGKSALLSALDVIAGDSGDLTSVRHAGWTVGCQVSARFKTSEDERARFLGNVKDRDQLLAAGAVSDLEFVFEEAAPAALAQGLSGVGLAKIRGEWPGHGLVLLAEARWETPGQSQIVMAVALAGGETDNLDMTAHANTGGMEWLDHLLPGWDRTRPLGQPLQRWRERYYHFRALRQGTERSQVLSSPGKLDPTGSNLAGVLHYLATDRRQVFEQARDLIAQVVPDIGTLQVRTGGDRMRVVFESSYGDTNLKDMGTGVEQLLMTLVVGLMEAPPFTLVVEEPETNLHPHAQRALLNMLQTWGADRDRLIVAATHSTVMLDWSPGGDRLWLVTRDGDESQVQPVDEDPLPLLRSLGVRLSDVLSADRLLALEGPSDEDVLGRWFPELLRNPRVAILSGEGGENARHADRLATWIAEADRAGPRRVLYLRDRDELSGPVLAKLEASPNVYVLQRRELENYLLNPDALAQVIGSLVRSAAAPSSTDVAAFILQTAESLRTKIIVNRVCRRFAPPLALMNDDVRKELASSATAPKEIVTALQRHLMTSDAVQEQISGLWAETEAEVTTAMGEDLLAIAPGEEILDAVFMRFTRRHYRKRAHGEAIARATPRPEEIGRVIDKFLVD